MKIFQPPTCPRRFPNDFGKGRPCLNFHLKQCCAPCTGRVKFDSYNEAVESALEFLKGGSGEYVRKMTEEMRTAAENLQFERAAQLRDRLSAIKKLGQRQKVMESKLRRRKNLFCGFPLQLGQTYG